MRKFILILSFLLFPLAFLSGSLIKDPHLKETFFLNTEGNKLVKSSIVVPQPSQLDSVKLRSSAQIKVREGISNLGLYHTKKSETKDEEQSLDRKSEFSSTDLARSVDYTKMSTLLNEGLEFKIIEEEFIAFQARVRREKYYNSKTRRVFRKATYHENPNFSVQKKVIIKNEINLRKIKEICPLYKNGKKRIKCTESLFFKISRDQKTLTPLVKRSERRECRKFNLTPSSSISFEGIDDFYYGASFDSNDIVRIPENSLNFKNEKTFFTPDEYSLFEVTEKESEWISCFPEISIRNYLGVAGQSCFDDKNCMNGCCQNGICSEEASTSGCSKKAGESCLDNSFCSIGESVFVIDLKMKKNRQGVMKCSSQFEGMKTNLFCLHGKCSDITMVSVQPYYSKENKDKCNEAANPEYIKYFKPGRPESEAEVENYIP